MEIKPLIGGMDYEVEEPFEWDHTWEGYQISALNYCIKTAKELLGEAWFWVPLLYHESATTRKAPYPSE